MGKYTLFIIMPHYVLGLRRVVVNMYVCFADTDSIESHLNTGPDNLHAVRVAIATDVNGTTMGMGTFAGSFVRFLPCGGTISRCHDERNAGLFTRRIQLIHKGLVHVL